jgi:excisionase family DNA binding protein
MPTDLLTVPELADRLRLSRKSVYRLVSNGTLPARRLHARGKLLFDADEVSRRLGQAEAVKDLAGA